MDISINISLLIIIAVFCTHCEGLCTPPCTGNFVCSGSSCICNTGYYGASCTDTCESSGAGSCQNSGTCGSSSPKSCSCVTGFTGTLCETESSTTTTTSTTTTAATSSQNSTASISMCLFSPFSAFITFALLYKILKYQTRNPV
ncbi:Cadherin EGF LAG seven-pass G-type receptor 3 [Mizuhopecten yessoensis]|uniref:Cadherin EGF LAG seven-pass G-type receptor 3 n=1 Tax=Mizuhopecten yessoensis TaxID=6573 RepID=A0A210QA26_MIZYE|nr:Cadherin EGF LAG seven-pass G-type receptor 3 [Mizuhopecten yessoensis]